MSTGAYVDLMFAFGHARLGDEAAARQLTAAAAVTLGSANHPIHTWLFDAYRYRIEQAIAGGSHEGPLPVGLLRSYAGMDEDRASESSRRYAVDRVRQISRILERDEVID